MDPSTLQVSGTPIRILDGGMMNWSSGAADVAVSTTGTLAFAPGGPMTLQAMELVSMDGRGVASSISSERRAYAYPSFSPDGTRLAVTARAALDDVWICDLRRQTFTRLTFTLGNNWCPVWTPDGKRVVFASDRSDGSLNIYWKSADGTGPEERLTQAQATQVPTSIAPDARTLVYAQADAKTGFDLWLLSLADRRTTPFLQTPFNERQAMFSPDGKWLVYTSDESGHDEVYVRPYPGPGSRIRISTDIGSDPRWSPNGHELFYRRGDVVMRAAITTTPVVTVGVPAAFATAPTIASGFGLDYDVATDGRRLVVLSDKGMARMTTELSVVLNWFSELRAAIPDTR
jgi:serine/threonine-protein kinase